MATIADPVEIPGPKPHPVVGNALDIDPHDIVGSYMRLADRYGPIFQLQIAHGRIVVVSSRELADELCDESRFDKAIRHLAGTSTARSLFMAETHSHDWMLAHRVLQPGFGVATMRTLAPAMWDVAEQMLVKWERTQGERIDFVDAMSRLTLDTIALCGFDYRFNSFYRETMHPFVQAMTHNLMVHGQRNVRPKILTRFRIAEEHRVREDQRLMARVAAEVIAEHKRGGPGAHHDLLDIMLSFKDPDTGEQMPDELIAQELIMFLVAGHETTSGMLSFAMYELLENPEVLAQARAFVDATLGGRDPGFEDIRRLGYIDQILKETLRLWPTAQIFGLRPYDEQTTLAGKYVVRHDDDIFLLLRQLHRDPSVWEEPDRFIPERFAPEAYEKLPANAWKPFGNGQRSCIGRPFAMQEATLVLASLLQRFDIAKADPDYRLQTVESLTIKPKSFFVIVKRRAVSIAPATAAPVAAPAPAAALAAAATLPVATSAATIGVLYGSNSGSAEAFAQRIAGDAKLKGYGSSLATLDSAVGKLRAGDAVAIVTASYEGHPADNAKEFVAWVEDLAPGALDGVRFTVFGCGNRDWAQTYQRIPKLIDAKLAEAGATRLMERGEADARADFFGDFDRWYAAFWPTMTATLGAAPGAAVGIPHLIVEFTAGAREPIVRQNGLQMGTVVENRQLVDMSSPFARSKHHLEIALPAGMQYRAGDYLAVLASNPLENVARALRHFGLAYDAQVILRPSAELDTFFPLDRPVMAGELLASYVELGQPATREHVAQLLAPAVDAQERAALEALSGEAYIPDVLEKRMSVLDLLELHPSSEVAFGVFLQMLPPLRPRQYSISSSPLWSATHCTLTVSELKAEAWSGRGVYRGIASNYLANAQLGMRVAVTTRPSQAGFHLPDDPQTPIIMVAAGAGIAPFRGFIQERAFKLHDGATLGKALLFFGCDHPQVDFLYRDELSAWSAEGAVELHPTFDHQPENDCQYVQHRLWAERAGVMALVDAGAHIYVCGDGKHMAPAVRETFGKMYGERNQASTEQIEAWLTQLHDNARYVQDVFG